MSKPFDATMRQLIELGPVDWLRFLGISIADPNDVTVIDSNLSTITAEADKVVWIAGAEPWIEHIELQASRDSRLAERSHLYNVLLSYQHRVPVRTALVLLRPEAFGVELTGILEKRHPGEAAYCWFRYDILKVWEQPVETLLAAGLPVLPLAPVSKVASDAVPDVLIAISERLNQEATPEQRATLWAATKILMGLRYPRETVDTLIEGISAMILGIRGIEESSVYQGIFAEGEAKGEANGRLKEARELLLRIAEKKLGRPEEQVLQELRSLNDLERLHGMADRVGEVSSWDELQRPQARERISAMILGIRGIEESSVYQAIFAEVYAKGFEKGRLDEAREILLMLAEDKFGRPVNQVLHELNALVDREQLHRMILRVSEVSSWDELLALPR